MDWINVKVEKPKGKCIVCLEKESAGNRIHSATFRKNVSFVGHCFEFDVPKITHWMPQPDLPEEEKHD